MAQLRQELSRLEGEQTSVESRGVQIERQLRDKEVRPRNEVVCITCIL